jgi:hypothetical protein
MDRLMVLEGRSPAGEGCIDVWQLAAPAPSVPNQMVGKKTKTGGASRPRLRDRLGGLECGHLDRGAGRGGRVGDDIEIAGEPHTQSVSLTGIRRGGWCGRQATARRHDIRRDAVKRFMEAPQRAG